MLQDSGEQGPGTLGSHVGPLAICGLNSGQDLPTDRAELIQQAVAVCFICTSMSLNCLTDRQAYSMLGGSAGPWRCFCLRLVNEISRMKSDVFLCAQFLISERMFFVRSPSPGHGIDKISSHASFAGLATSDFSINIIHSLLVTLRQFFMKA